MRTLGGRLVLAVVVASIVAAAVIVAAVQWYSAEHIARVLMEGVDSQGEADAMVEQYVGRVVAIAAVAGMALGSIVAWWLVRRVLRPLAALRDATRRVAAGDFDARIAEPADEELREVARAFNQMTATLQRVEELRTTLVEDVAHELRTPLTTLRGYTEALADGIASPTQEMLLTVHDEIQRLARLVEALDELARNRTSAREQARAEIDLGDMIARALELSAPELAGRAIHVRVDRHPGLPRLVADPDAMRQVVANLVQNAARYTTDGGEITVRLRSEGGSVLCAVTNSGPDIPDRELPLIWERLHRVDPSRSRATGGAGIGLAIVRQIVEAHGGEVGARSGGGRTEIWFRLPASS